MLCGRVEDAALRARLAAGVVSLHTADSVVGLARERSRALILIDRPGPGADPAGLRKAGRPVALVRDGAARADVAADLTIDPNWRSAGAPEDPRLIGGIDYIPLRSEFAALRPPEPELQREKLGCCLVTLGGTATRIDFEGVLGALARLELTRVELVLASVAPAESIAARARELSLDCSIQVAVDELPRRLAAADLVVVAAGMSMSESLCLGLPTASYWRNDYQAGVVRGLAAAGAVGALGPLEEAGRPEAVDRRELTGLTSRARREGLASRAHALVDGRGAERLAARLWQCCAADD